MSAFLWILQVVLAVAFLGAGLLKITQPKEKLAPRMGWVDDFSPGMVKFIGTVEVLAAVGLILPALTGIGTVLVPLAALGLVFLMVGAAITHARRGEAPMVIPNVVLLVLAAIVAWGRFGSYHF